ncbi:MAG: hypothetical protein JO306_17145 [Gemmatimonadetes bacterium]|nr:hypothetical protein [Gemmatimonadota bacterium]
MSRPDPNPQPPDRVEMLANSLARVGRAGELEAELGKMDPGSLTRAEQETWWRFRGVAAFQDGREAEALARFEEAHRHFPGNALIRFSLGQQYIRAGQQDRGFELFRSSRFPEVPREYAFAEARYAYLCSRYDDGFSSIEPFYQEFVKLRILDDNFLFVRGMPFFGDWWAHAAAFAILAGRPADLESITRYFAAMGSDYDFEQLQAEWAAYRDDDPARLVPRLEQRLDYTEKNGFPAGYARMALAAARSRTAPTLDDARRILGAVILSSTDNPWLDDVRTLALAEAAHRFGDADEEQARTNAFLARQPMLLQPDLALRFHLLRYQELLKPRVIGRWARVATGG